MICISIQNISWLLIIKHDKTSFELIAKKFDLIGFLINEMIYI